MLWHAVMIGITGSRTVNVPIAVLRLWMAMRLQAAAGRLYCAKLVERLHVMGHASHVPPHTRLPNGGAGVCANNAMPGE